MRALIAAGSIALATLGLAACSSGNDEAVVTVTKTPDPSSSATSSTAARTTEEAAAGAPQGGQGEQAAQPAPRGQARQQPTAPEPLPTLPLDALDAAIAGANSDPGYIPEDTHGDANIFATGPGLAGGGAPELPGDAGGAQAGY